MERDVIVSTTPQEVKKVSRGSSNRRATVRYRCAPATTGKIAVEGDQELQRAWILDLSATGAGLEIARPIEAGAFLIIHLKGRTRDFQLPAHVAHATRQPRGEWLVGCELDQRLSDADLDELLD